MGSMRSRSAWRSSLPLVGLASTFAALQLATAWVEPYGLFHDELYYWAGARRLELGYVDHPPLAPWLLAGTTSLLGDGRLAFRLVPALCGAGTLLLTGLMARRLGAGSFGRLLAGSCVAVMPVTLVLFSFYSVNALEILLWTAATYLLVELLRTRDERLWLGVGAVGGVALLDKHTFALLAAGIAVGIAATPLRGRLRSRWPWYGAGVALLLALPNVVWNARHDWPSLAFYRSRPAADLPASALEALEIQILGSNPVNLLVWLPGLFFLLFSRRARPHRPLAIAFLTLFLVSLLSNQRRADRIAGVYPVVLAAGAAWWDRWKGRGHHGVRFALIGLVLAGGALALPATLPILSPRAAADYLDAIDAPEIETADVGRALPLHLEGRLWAERFAEGVAEAWEALPSVDRGRAVVLAPHWVFASAVEYYARDRGLPAVVAPHNAYWFWRGEAAGHDAVLAVAIPADVLSRYFAEAREVRVLRCESCGRLGPDLPVVLARGPVRPLEVLLAEWRWFSIEPTPHLTR
jgi:hypothetical protein